MPRYAALLRAINVGGNRKVPMARLRELLEADGFTDVATYVNSGNVVLASPDPAATVSSRIAALLADEFGFEVPTIVRTKAQLATVVATDPIPAGADAPKHYQVTFLERKLPASTWSDVDPQAWGDSTFVATPTELFTFTPGGIHADKLLRALAKAHKDTPGTARNWSTVCRLLDMLGD
ncbi:MAG: hypothetical protein JWL76_2307 [Thermoleophilia bacterium]|nr:hypothetical protein [Thermoleophilia bacterium]